MVISVVREYKWSPNEIGSLYLDDADFFGLEYWYKDVIAIVNA